MTLRLEPIPHVGSHLLFLKEVLAALAARGVDAPLLFRASEMDKLPLVAEHGTDRAGHEPGRVWDGESPGEEAIPHEDVVLATTEEDIRRGEREPGFSTSFKKFGLRGAPLLLVYDARHFLRLREKEYAFRHPDRKKDALLALIPVDLQPEIPGWFSQEEGWAYRTLVEKALDRPRAGPRRVVEVGCWMGRSTAWIARYCKSRGAELIGVDAYAGSSDDYDACYRETLAERDVAAIFRERMAALGANVQLLRRFSSEAARAFEPASLDFVFLDASHDDRAVQRDLEDWWPRLHPGGTLAGHDFNPDHAGLADAVTAFAGTHRLQVERGPGSLWWLAR